jgi:hypothetical protein
MGRMKFVREMEKFDRGAEELLALGSEFDRVGMRLGVVMSEFVIEGKKFEIGR